MKINRNLQYAKFTTVKLKTLTTETSDDELTTIMRGEYNMAELTEFPFIAEIDNGLKIFVTGYDPEENAYSGSFSTGFNSHYILDISDGTWGLSITQDDESIAGTGQFQ